MTQQIQTSKPLSEWYSELPEPYKKQAIENRAESPTKNQQASSKHEAVRVGFYWAKTHTKGQGHYYWERFFFKLKKETIEHQSKLQARVKK